MKERRGRLAGGKVDRDGLHIPAELVTQKMGAGEKLIRAMLIQFPRAGEQELALVSGLQLSEVQAVVSNIQSTEVKGGVFETPLPPRKGERAQGQARARKGSELERMSKEEQLIALWNVLPGTRTHALSDEPSKVVRSCVKLFRVMQAGKMATLCELEDPEQRKAAERRWTLEELRVGLHNLSQIYVEGRWPRNKDRLPRNLNELLYNVHTRKSMFLRFAAEPPAVVRSVDSVPVGYGVIAERVELHLGLKCSPELFPWLTELHRKAVTSSALGVYLCPTVEHVGLGVIDYLLDQPWFDPSKLPTKTLHPGSAIMRDYAKKVLEDVRE